MNQLQVAYSSSFKFILAILGFFTCGVGALMMWLSSRKWPVMLDDTGITLRNGQHFRWDQLSDIKQVTVVSATSGHRLTGRVDLMFSKTKVPIVPQSLAQGQAVLDHLSQRFGQKIQSG